MPIPSPAASRQTPLSTHRGRSRGCPKSARCARSACAGRAQCRGARRRGSPRLSVDQECGASSRPAQIHPLSAGASRLAAAAASPRARFPAGSGRSDSAHRVGGRRACTHRSEPPWKLSGAQGRQRCPPPGRPRRSLLPSFRRVPSLARRPDPRRGRPQPPGGRPEGARPRPARALRRHVTSAGVPAAGGRHAPFPQLLDGGGGATGADPDGGCSEDGPPRGPQTLGEPWFAEFPGTLSSRPVVNLIASPVSDQS